MLIHDTSDNTNPFHNIARIALGSQLYDPQVDFEQRMINRGCVAGRRDRDKIPH